MDLAAPSTGFSCACSAGFHDDGGVCEPNKCNALTLSDGMIGTGSDACVNGLVLNGVFDKECDYTCMPGYTGVSTGGSSQFECGINGGTQLQTTNVLKINVTASKWVQTWRDLPTVRSVHVPLCNSFPPVITRLVELHAATVTLTMPQQEPSFPVFPREVLLYVVFERYFRVLQKT